MLGSVHVLASYPGHVGGGKSGLVSTVCACAKNPMISWGIVYHRLRTVNLYRILAYSSEAHPSRAYRAKMAGKTRTLDKALKFALCCMGKGDFTLKEEQLDAIKCIYDGKDVFLWLPSGFGKSICYETLPFVFNYNHSNSGCSVVLVVSPLVSLINYESHHRVNTAATLQAVYLVWLFLRITTTCKLVHNQTHSRKISGIVRACANSGYQATFPSSHVAWVRGYTCIYEVGSY